MLFNKPSLVTRIAVGKLVGLLFGLSGLILMPYFWPEAGWLIRWGVLFWYTTLGAIIGIFGVFTYHPVLKIPMPWWFMSPLLGAWMNLVLTFFIYDQMVVVMATTFGPDSFFSSPFWLVGEGAVIGFIIGYLATRFGGEGPETSGK